MHELVLVLSDFYVSQETPDRELPEGVALPGLNRVMRFGRRSPVSGGWRPWLSHWLSGTADDPPATVVAASMGMSRWVAPPTPGLSPTVAPTAAWMATPVHLLAGMTTIHLDRRSILRLSASDQEILAADFQRVFHDSGFYLQPLAAGDFLMSGPQMPIVETLEPARLLGASMADAQHTAATSPELLRLAAELEMWLHDHAVNDARQRRGEPPVTALWLWGRGPAPPVGDVGTSYTSGRTRDPLLSDEINAPRPRFLAANPASDIAFGRDSYVDGLWSTRGATVFPLPQQLADVFGYPHARRALVLVEIGQMLQANPTWTFFDALVSIDRSFIMPAVEALNRGECKRLVILANDYELTLLSRDRFKFWRRTPPGLSGLQ